MSILNLKDKLKQHQEKLKNLSRRVFNAQAFVLSQSTPYDVIATFEQTQVRYYAAHEQKFAEPLVFIAPLAINMAIYDLFPYRSLVQYFSQAGFNVYLIDWGKLSYQHRQLNFLKFIDDFIPKCIATIQAHSQQDKISLHGWSMAGIFALLYTAKHQPDAVKNLIILGSPVDSYASGNIGKLYQHIYRVVEKYPKLKNRLSQQRFPNALTHSPGIINAIGFKVLDPKGWYQGHKQLLQNLNDPQVLYEHATLGHFLNHMVDYPGGINQDMLLNIWLFNPLKQGKIQLGQHVIDLKAIDCSLLVGAGSNDQMVTAAAAQPLTTLTRSKDVEFHLIPGGHLGLMSNQKSAAQFWPQLAAWLAARSIRIETQHDTDSINA